MNSMLTNYFVSFKLGEGVRHRNMVVFPIAAPLDEGLEYRTLKEALELGVLAVTEVSEGGSALVVNDKPVHVAFFSATDSDKAGFMAGSSRRRGFRL